ncbi:GNAT family N-acetyltransferase [Bacillus chungangensis]|uniref:Aspartate aminotransferase-like enzyme/predicted N-acetyltransferase YhbS n=1 Tax=Bacillus chungangensis TaxID=587633 RepID=A0ABT9WR01_9BACI|nr:GNAT family N-acetyltransferase [Bacillus chungangensis]MDQ0175640.1 aspartate aminotransferase-like enzyme/predicted N-acetyltransferase YhbS [Bacillus chungangensis]
MSFVFKIAREPAEFEQINILNYKTFAEEIPQHEENDQQRLVDKFHTENTYIICKKDNQVIGMIAVRGKRPFSLDGKIGSVEKHLPISPQKMCEIRLLAVDPAHRNGRVFLGLAQGLIRYCLKEGYDTALISGTTIQEKLYKQMGFTPFAYLTGEQGAYFQPMYLTKQTFEMSLAGRIRHDHINFLPGPLMIAEEVSEALNATPISHRSTAYRSLLTSVQNKLKKLTNANHVQLFHGTGTLANDVVAGQLLLLKGKGLILVNGEFGQRLVDHATRFGLDFECLQVEWGQPFQATEVARVLNSSNYRWMWAVHSETSTGILNDLHMLKELSTRFHLQLALDCISSLGTVALDLQGISYASGVSGKGLAGYTGISFVFHDQKAEPTLALPRYLDLGTYQMLESLPYSQSSNLVQALETALRRFREPEQVYKRIYHTYCKIREKLESAGVEILTPMEHATPAIMTVALKKDISSQQIGDDMYLNGYLLHYESSYLCSHNWIQIACMSELTDKQIEKMAILFGKLLAERSSHPTLS